MPWWWFYSLKNHCCSAPECLLLRSHSHVYDLYWNCVRKSTTQHQINPQLTHAQTVRTDSLSSDQWAAENYSLILLTSDIFKEIPEKGVLP